MNKHLLTKAMLLLFALVVGSSSMWGAEFVINTTNFTKATEASATSGYAAYDGDRDISGITITSNKVMVQSSNIQFQTNNGYLYNKTAIPGKITKITLATTTNFTIYVGTTENPSTTTVTSGKEITGNYTYFKIKGGASTPKTATITVEYSSGLSVTYNGNGNTSGTVPTDATTYTSGATVTVLGNTGDLAKAGYTFDGWNTTVEGNGTSYSAGETFSITANTTLYAKWNAKTITSLTKSGTPTKTVYAAGENFDPTGLTVTATFDDSSNEEVTPLVAWEPSPLTKGTTSVTGTYMDKTITVDGLTVTAVPGTDERPFTVAEALAYIEDGGSTSATKYVKGIISSIESTEVYNSTYLTYSISDDGSTTDELYVYSGKALGDEAFSDVSDIKVGDRVTICGKLTTYKGTKEFGKDNYLVSQVRDFTFTLDDMTNGSATVQVNGETQTPNGDGELTIASGATITLTATPASGYNFAKWTSTHSAEDNSIENPLTFAMPFEDVMMGATFADASVTYDIVVDDAITGGTISADKTQAKADEVVTLTATPAANYVFGAWDVQDENYVAITVTDNKFTMPASDVIVTATFKKIHTITYYVGGSENTTTRIDGEELNLDAPSAAFVGWSSVNSAASPVFVANNSVVTGDMTLYAIFASSSTVDYRLVEADQTDWRGDYLIAYSDAIFADGRVGNKDGSGTIGGLNVKVSPDDKLSGKVVDLTWGDKYNVTLEAIDDTDLSKGYVMKGKDNYYIYYTQNNNGITSSVNKVVAQAYPITVNFQSSSDVRLALGGNAKGAVFRYNTGGYFRYYKDCSQKAVYLYKRTTSAVYTLDEYDAVTMNGAGYATLASTSALDLTALPEGVTAYKATVSGKNVTLKPVAQKVEANTGILLKGDADKTYYIPVADSGSAVEGNDFQVNTTGATFAATTGKLYFALKKSADELQFATFDPSTLAIPATKAYLEVDESAFDSGSRELTFGFDDSETTGISDATRLMDNGKMTKDKAFFNLNGQRVSQPTRGLYIVNGRKVVIK